jgi:GNAT superfamily N-acetyltransferase
MTFRLVSLSTIITINIFVFFNTLAIISPVPKQVFVPNIGTLEIQQTDDAFQLFKKDNNEFVGILEYYLSSPETAYMSWFRIVRHYRRHGVGKILFGLFAKTMKHKKLKKITWSACPIDPDPGITEEQQLTKLIKFYESVGGRVVQRYRGSAAMEYNLNS